MSFDFRIDDSKEIEGVKLITPSMSTDERGDIWTSFTSGKIDTLLPDKMLFTHDKFSESKKNVLRGIHGDEKSWKLVTCIFGEICQVVVDLREGSKTYKRWQKFFINKENQKSVLIPPGVGNAYYVLSKKAVYHYKLAYAGEYLDSDRQFTVPWNDQELGIDWPCANPILSVRDKQ